MFAPSVPRPLGAYRGRGLPLRRFGFFAAALRRERQSGFLFPEFGQSSRRGYFAKVPCYWATQRLLA